jgi:3-hydroxyisobutyrate dehydrogenase
MANRGFIGLGHMGLPMAINLIKAGHHVTGFDLDATALKAFAKAGGLSALSLSHAAKTQDAVITMLQTGEQVKQVCLSPNGIFAAASPDTLIIDCSSIDVASSREIHEQAANHHLRALDAPVSGGVKGAEAGTLTIMVGGFQEVFLAAKPLLAHMGQTLIYTGEAGSGQAAKICNNMILGISMIAVSEAFILGKQLGLTPQKLFEVVSHSSGHCWVMDNYVPVAGVLDNVPANHAYQPGFTATMMLKDLMLSQQSATSVGIKTPIAHHATQLYQQLQASGMGHLDFSAIIKLLGDE